MIDSSDEEREEEEETNKSSQIFCLTWLKRNVGKKMPDRVQLTKKEVEDIIKMQDNGDDQGSDGNSGSEDEESNDEDGTKAETKTNGETNKQIKKEEEKKEDEDDVLKEFDFDHYDSEEEEMYADPLSSLVAMDEENNPYADEELSDEETDGEKEALQLKDDDNYLVCCRWEEDYSCLEVFVYNEETKDFYIHHDVPLSNPPLCMKWLDYDSSNSEPGNFLALGHMDSTVEIWDLDVVNTMEPAYVLGIPADEHDDSIDDLLVRTHSDAVLDIEWTEKQRSSLYSCSADETVALWDLESGRIQTRDTNHRDKVQTIALKPGSTTTLLSGAFDGRVLLSDFRSDCTTKVVAKWKVTSEIEKVRWCPSDDNYFIASTNRGKIFYYDVRNTGKSLFSWKAHDDAIPAVLMTSRNDVMTASNDGTLRKWKIVDENCPNLVCEKEMKMGMIHCLHMNPDVPSVLALGGQKGGVRIQNTNKLDISQPEDSVVETNEEVNEDRVETPDKEPPVKKNKTEEKQQETQENGHNKKKKRKRNKKKKLTIESLK